MKHFYHQIQDAQRSENSFLYYKGKILKREMQKSGPGATVIGVQKIINIPRLNHHHLTKTDRIISHHGMQHKNCPTNVNRMDTSETTHIVTEEISSKQQKISINTAKNREDTMNILDIGTTTTDYGDQ